MLQGAAAVEIKAEAVRRGMRVFAYVGHTQDRPGVTSVEEVARITAAD